MAAKKKIAVTVNSALAVFNKSAVYKGKVYAPGEKYELPVECLKHMTMHFGAEVPSFMRVKEVQSESDGTKTKAGQRPKRT